MYFHKHVPLLGHLKLRKEETLKIYPDISKAKKILNWKPKIEFNKGLKETLKYYEAKK